jgi:hypothetical protein
MVLLNLWMHRAGKGHAKVPYHMRLRRVSHPEPHLILRWGTSAQYPEQIHLPFGYPSLLFASKQCPAAGVLTPLLIEGQIGTVHSSVV